jgi:hypothetical protein
MQRVNQAPTAAKASRREIQRAAERQLRRMPRRLREKVLRIHYALNGVAR